MTDFKKKVIYQIYPKSFKDSDGDGVGDIQGIIEKLPYLQKLGIEMIWFNPFYPSPQNDNGYDISDYCQIDPLFGTMTDFERLISEMEKFGIEMMLDMVFNHTSTKHVWFQRALAGEKKYQKYYILRPAKANGDLPTNWVSKFGGHAWQKFGETDLYYLHLYDVTQADLDWRNPDVRQELYRVINFWRNKGVKGFRFDVINVIGKAEELLDDPTGDGKKMYTDQPIIHEYLQEMNRQTFGQDARIITVGEMSATTVENCILYSQTERKELTMTFNFHHLKVDYPNGEKWQEGTFDFEQLKDLLHGWGQRMSAEGGWNALFWNNHDQPRALTRFLDDKNYRVEGAKLLAAAIHLSRGTPYIYQGEEIGMTDPKFDKLADYRDIETLNAYKKLQLMGYSEAKIMRIIQAKSRDNSRTPMQWSDEPSAGFSTGEPWLPVAENYQKINVETELDHGSIFSFYQRLIQLRKNHLVISEGSYTAYATEHPQIYGYIRSFKKQRLLVLNNFFEKAEPVPLPAEFISGKLLVGNYPEAERKAMITLRPYETLAILI